MVYFSVGIPLIILKISRFCNVFLICQIIYCNSDNVLHLVVDILVCVVTNTARHVYDTL